MRYTVEEKQEIINDQKQMQALVEKYGKEDIIKYINDKLNEEELEEPIQFNRPARNEKQLQMMQDVKKFAEAVKIAMDEDHYNCTKTAAKVIVNITKKARQLKDKFIPKEVDDIMICTFGEAVIMLACMLLDDEYGPESVKYIGYNGYRGNNNPYDYSWFEEEVTDEDSDYYEKDVLEFFQTLYKENIEFKKYFDSIYYQLQKV